MTQQPTFSAPHSGPETAAPHDSPRSGPEAVSGAPSGARPYLVAHGHVLQVPLPDDAAAAIARVIRSRLPEFDAALAPHGFTMADLLEPVYMIAVRPADVVAYDSPSAAMMAAGADLAADHPSGCAHHEPVQHRDGREPWCSWCGGNADGDDPRGRL